MSRLRRVQHRPKNTLQAVGRCTTLSTGISGFKVRPLFLFPSDMDSLIQQLASQQVWEEFLAYRLQKGCFTWTEFDAADTFVEREQYLPVVESIIEGMPLSIPRKITINKQGSDKKRTVYSFTPEEMTVLKVVAHLLYRYDDYFAPNCYAFRRGTKATDGVMRIHREVRGKHLWAYKLDIHNYFNSIPIPRLLGHLAELFKDDTMLYRLFEQTLSNDKVEYNGEILHEEHGAMAGVPTAPFLANVYLCELDRYFWEHGVIYARYSDDIIVFAESEALLQEYKSKIAEFLADYRLEINPTKERIYTPDEPYEFLGFRCSDNRIDVSEAGVKKMKGKIRRKTRALLRWKRRKGIPARQAMTRLIGYFNRKFYDGGQGRTLTWARWYFPIINSTEGLQEIDHYLQQSIRLLGSGRQTKASYRITYEEMKELGYKSLVHEYYKQHRQAHRQGL